MRRTRKGQAYRIDIFSSLISRHLSGDNRALRHRSGCLNAMPPASLASTSGNVSVSVFTGMRLVHISPRGSIDRICIRRTSSPATGFPRDRPPHIRSRHPQAFRCGRLFHGLESTAASGSAIRHRSREDPSDKPRRPSRARVIGQPEATAPELRTRPVAAEAIGGPSRASLSLTRNLATAKPKVSLGMGRAISAQ